MSETKNDETIEPLDFYEIHTLIYALYTSYEASKDKEHWKKNHSKRATSAYNKLQKMGNKAFLDLPLYDNIEDYDKYYKEKYG